MKNTKTTDSQALTQMKQLDRLLNRAVDAYRGMLCLITEEFLECAPTIEEQGTEGERQFLNRLHVQLEERCESISD